MIGPPKTKAGGRTITLPPSCVAALELHRRRQGVERIHAGPRWTERTLIFPAPDGDLMHRSTPYNRLLEIAKEAGLPRIRFHDLRHTAATLMLVQGVSPRVGQERLGHSSLAMFLGLYSHVTLTMQAEAADKMDAMFGMEGLVVAEELDRAADD